MVKTADNVLVVDAYNANPSSMKASLENFANIKAAHKVALLGDMRELGEVSVAEHVAILELASVYGLDTLCVVGEEFGKALRKVNVTGDVRWYADSDALAAAIQSAPFKDSLILVKGSRGMRMEKAIPCL